MMSIFNKIKASLLSARKAHDAVTTASLSTFLEGMRSDIMGDLSPSLYGIYSPEDGVVVRYLKNVIKTSNGAIASAEKVSKESSLSFVEKTKVEITLLESFLPKQLSDAELNIAVGMILSNTTLEGGKLIGHVIAELKLQYEGLFDAAKVRTILTGK